MPRRTGGVGRTHPWLLYLAATAAALLAAELVVIETIGQSWRGRPSTIAGWFFEVVVAGLLVGVARSEATSRRRTARLVESLDESLASITALTEASLSSLRLDELLSQLLARLRDLLEVDVVTIFLLSEDGNWLEARASQGHSDLDIANLRLPVTDGLIGRAIATRIACTSNESDSLADLSRRIGQSIASAAACPIHVEDRLIGACAVMTSSDVRFGDRELHLLQVVADRAGTGIERTRLDEAERRSRLELERARRHVTMLADASVVLSTAKDEYEANLASLVDIAIPQFSDWCAIDLLESDGTLRRLAVRYGRDEADRSTLELERRAPFLHSMVRRVLADYGPEVLSDSIMRSPAAPTDELSPAPSCIVVAIRVNGRSFGAITFAVDADRPAYESSDVATANDLARRIAITIERVLLYREVSDAADRSQRIASQLHQLIAASLDVQQLNAAEEVLECVVNRARLVFESEHAVVVANFNSGEVLRAVSEIGAEDRVERLASESWDLATPIFDISASSHHDDRWISAQIGSATGVDRGTIAIRRAIADAPGEDDEAVLALLAQMTAGALDSVDLYETIQASEARWRVLVEAAPIGIVEVDLDGKVRWWNRASAALFSWSDIETANGSRPEFPAKVIEELRSLWSETVVGPQVLGRELLGVPIGDETRDLAVSGAPLIGKDGEVQGILTLVGDMTDRLRLEADLRQAQRMEAVGQLAGSVAHDFNNLLTLINGYAELLRSQLMENARGIELIEDVTTVTGRAALLTGQLLTISRRQPTQPVVLDPVVSLESIIDVLARIVGSEISLNWYFDASTDNIEVDPAGLQQIVVNLAINARDAMPDGGELTITVGNINFDGQQARRLDDPKGPYVRIVVKDTGVGMDEETLKRCFEPFYTTKVPYRGTGLGLPAVRGVVTDSHGLVRVESELGAGTCFEILFPSMGATASNGRDPKVAPGARSSESVLVADDDDDLRLFMRQILVHNGYQVLAAPTGNAALKLADESLDAIDLLVTDVAMPGMNGPELAVALRARNPDLMVLFVSGSTQGIELPELARGSLSYLAKPFVPSELIAAIRQLLDSRSKTTHSTR